MELDGKIFENLQLGRSSTDFWSEDVDISLIYDDLRHVELDVAPPTTFAEIHGTDLACRLSVVL